MNKHFFSLFFSLSLFINSFFQLHRFKDKYFVTWVAFIHLVAWNVFNPLYSRTSKMFHYVARRKQMVKFSFFFFFNRIAFRSLYSSTRTEKKKRKNFTNRTRLIFQNLDEFRRKEISNFFPTRIKKKNNLFVISRFFVLFLF